VGSSQQWCIHQAGPSVPTAAFFLVDPGRTVHRSNECRLSFCCTQSPFSLCPLQGRAFVKRLSFTPVTRRTRVWGSLDGKELDRQRSQPFHEQQANGCCRQDNNEADDSELSTRQLSTRQL